MANKKITPRFTFQVGEKVVICDAVIPFGNSTPYYPDPKDFTFTTIKEVLEDGSVIVEEGYRYRQSYETSCGYTELHGYFRINRLPRDSKTYYFINEGYREPNDVVPQFSTFLPSYLFKFDQSWQDKADKIKVAYQEAQRRKQEIEDHEAKKQPFLDAYKERVRPLQERLNKLQLKAWKEEVCAHCIKNRNGYCVLWKEDIKTKDGFGCTGFDVPNGDK